MSTQANPHLETDHIISLDRSWWGNKSGVSLYSLISRGNKVMCLWSLHAFRLPGRVGPVKGAGNGARISAMLVGGWGLRIDSSREP